MATVSSKQFTINVSDVVKGLIMAVLVPVMTIISQSLEAGSLTFDWKAISIAAVAGFVGYIVKNFLTPTSITVKPVSNEEAEAVKKGEAEVVVQTK